ncbi:MAG: phenylalanine--tRNA ligase subunit beta [Deltaproteobacteria bacterium]|nr:phenylalanine--tRNA ligase subunit beta [Deltaproteobacteria bacterium]
MIFSFNWLKEFVPTKLTAEEVSKSLTMAGVEVEAAVKAAPPLDGIVTAKILKKEKHPDADRLSLCLVSTGTEEFEIVCGAKNMKEGDVVPLATIGAVLPSGMKIKKSKLRGVTSYGMLCSEVELGLADSSDGLMILPEDLVAGEDITKALALDDYLLDLCITPNRADCLSVRGLAREVSAVTGESFKDTSVEFKEEGSAVSELAKVQLLDEELCPRYTATVIEGVEIKASPLWLSRRLESHGIRSINNIVDATNYVLLEYGQPLHAFDLDKIAGSELIVRRAKDKEKIVTLDGVERTLDSEMLVIADKDRPQALAGVMGGKESEVTDKTSRILLESASFSAASVRRTSRKTGLNSDSSYRFERGVDIKSVDLALRRVTALILELAGGKASKGLIDIYPTPETHGDVEFRVDRINKILGSEVESSEVESILTKLGIEVKPLEKKGVTVAIPPSFRVDIKCEVDLIEEVARLKGYDFIEPTMPKAELLIKSQEKGFELKRQIKEILVNAGFFEVLNYSFVSAEALKSLDSEFVKDTVILKNPLSADESVMRRTLLPSLLKNMELNLARGNNEIRIFEVRPVFKSSGEATLPQEGWLCSLLIHAPRHEARWNQGQEWTDFYDVKGIVERLFDSISGNDSKAPEFVADKEELPEYLHPGKSAALFVDGKKAGVLGALHPSIEERYDTKGEVYVLEFEVKVFSESSLNDSSYKALPKFPSSSRDLAFLIDKTVPYAEIEDAIRKLNTKDIENVEVFDVYYGDKIPEGKLSLALRLRYRSLSGTLKHEEVEETHAKVVALLEDKFSVELRV